MMQRTIEKISPKSQMSKSKSSTICAVVKRPDHHCDDDLVLKNLLETDDEIDGN